MRTKKIRGYSKILNSIDRWRTNNLELDVEELKYNQREYVKVWIHPFSTISALGSSYPAPTGKARKMILKGLIDIYSSWKKSLEELEQEYYLRLWLYPQDISKSQVVCAIGDFLNFYDGTFYVPEDQNEFPFDQFGEFKDRLQKFSWTQAHEEIQLQDHDVGEPEEYGSLKEYYAHRKWFNRKIRNARLIAGNEEGQRTYSVKQDIVWLGAVS